MPSVYREGVVFDPNNNQSRLSFYNLLEKNEFFTPYLNQMD